MTHPATRPGPTLHHRPWRRDSDLALLVPSSAGTTAAALQDAAADAAAAGYRAVLSPALDPERAAPWLAAGFRTHEHLHLLHHDLVAVPTASSGGLRRAAPWDRRRVLAIDHAAFADPFWRLDELGLDDALRATRLHRFRIERRRRGYAISGIADRRAYLQRLAVEPGSQRRGVGAALVADAVLWARAQRATSLSVNTQEHNEGALALYRRAGFVLDPAGLTVLRWDAPR